MNDIIEKTVLSILPIGLIIVLFNVANELRHGRGDPYGATSIVILGAYIVIGLIVIALITTWSSSRNTWFLYPINFIMGIYLIGIVYMKFIN